MTASPQNASLPREIRRKLAALRWWIRVYVWLQGLSLALIWLAAMFWIGLGLDYLPVLLGADEMPWGARAVLLAVVAAVLGVILYRWLLRRTLVRFGDASMAILLERHFPDLDESLITSVEVASDPGEATPLHRQMMATTQLQALKRLRGLHLRRVFNFRPLLASLGGVTLLATSIGLLYVLNAQALELGVQRLYLLEERPWPRMARIEIVGVEASQLPVTANAEAAIDLVPFEDGLVKVARGSEVALVVRADGSAEVVPEVCTISYRTSEGVRGRVNMTRMGQIQDGYQLYRYDGKPLRGILADVQFDVVGYDYRVRNYAIEVVDSPAVVGIEIDCVFPEYMVDASTSSWLPRTMRLSSGLRLPRGTAVTLRAVTNKPLRRVIINHAASDEQQVITSEGSASFRWQAPRLDQDLSAQITLVDEDGVVSERPYRILIEAVEDLPPVVNLRLRGIGSAVTPDVLLPLSGEVRDDYGVARSWVEVQVNDGDPWQMPLQKPRDLKAEIDFREQRREREDMQLQPGQILNLVVKAEDRYDLDGQPNVGLSDHYQLDVVTPQQLLAMLEARELGLRQRFEQVIEEMTETRDALVRVRSEGPEETATAEPGSPSSEAAAADAASAQPAVSGEEVASQENAAPPDGEGAERAEAGPSQSEAARRVWSLRLLRAQRAVLQSQKSAQETLGVAESFRDIRDELVHNRVDSEDRRQRLENAVIQPIEAIGGSQFAELDARLAALVASMQDQVQSTSEHPPTVEAAAAAVAQVDVILREMDQVLQNMLDLETYNELLDIVRSLIDEQQRLMGRTKEERKNQVLDLLQ